MKPSHRCIRWILVAACAAAGQLAHASGFQLISQSGSGLGNAFAGNAAAAEDAGTIFFNPAGMTYLPGRQVTGSVHALLSNLKFSDDGRSGSPLGVPAPAGGDNGGDAGGLAWVPNFYLSWQVTPKLWAGVGITPPFGLKTQYDPSFIGRFQSQTADFKTVDINPSIAYKVSDFMSLGAGISYQRARLGLSRSYSLVLAETPETVSLSDNGWGWNIGAMFNLGPATRLGISYRSIISYTLGGTVAVDGVGQAQAQAKLALPATTFIAVSHQFNDRLQLLGDFTWTQWSRIQNVNLLLTSGLGPFPAGTIADSLDFQFKDSYRVALGVNYRWTENLMLKLGTAYDKTPVPDAAHRLVLLPDSNRIWLSIGAKHQLTKNDALDIGYAHLFFLDNQTYRDKGQAFAPGDQGIVSGTYKNKGDSVAIQYTHSF